MKRASDPVTLTKREKEIMTLVASGVKQKKIAADLGVTYETVQTHFKNVRLKLNAMNTVHAVTIAVAKHLIII